MQHDSDYRRNAKAQYKAIKIIKNIRYVQLVLRFALVLAIPFLIFKFEESIDGFIRLIILMVIVEGICKYLRVKEIVERLK